MTLIIVASGIAAAFIITGHVQNLWGTKAGSLYFLLDNKALFPLYIPHVTSIKIWAYIISSRFLATLFICVWVILLKLLLKKNIYAFFVSLILLTMTDSFLPEQYNLFLGRTKVSMDAWLDTESLLFNIGYFLLVIIVLFFFCTNRYDKKEFYY